MNHKEYEHYVLRALFYEALGRTIDGFVGAISRKDPTVVVPPKFEVVTDEVTADGLNLPELAKRLCSEAILQGRLGILVDYDVNADRSYLTPYIAETITNWEDDQIILFETVYERDPRDPFKLDAIDQYRQLWLNDGVYTVTVWRKLKTEDSLAPDWAIYETIVPSRRGRPIDVIPFFWLTPVPAPPRKLPTASPPGSKKMGLVFPVPRIALYEACWLWPTQDGGAGPRLMRSVIPVRSCHGYAEHPTQKPEGIIAPLIEFSCVQSEKMSRDEIAKRLPGAAVIQMGWLSVSTGGDNALSTLLSAHRGQKLRPFEELIASMGQT